jgi:hypothetical protein
MKSFFPLVVFTMCLIIPETHAQGEAAPVAVELDPATVICPRFLGFGVEWDSTGDNASGITDADFAVIGKRVKWMRLPIVRIMMQTKWCYKGNDRYDWNDPQMEALYRHLDVCQRLGTTVLLTDWGIEPSWLKAPDVAKVEDPKYAAIISTYMDHLLNAKGYTCIRYFIQVNEPNLEVKAWDRWKAGVQNVAAEFHRKGLEGKIALMGSDHSGANDWHKNAVDQLQDTLGAYDIHRYATEDEVGAGRLFDYYKANWAYALTRDPKAKDKPLIVGEAGFFTPGFSASNNALHLDPRYGILMSDYAVQAVNAGSWAVLAWMLDDNSHPGFTWGMCKNREQGMGTKPWFYTWSLLRCFRPGMTIVQARVASPDVRVLAAYRDDKKSAEERFWTLCIVNRADAPRTLRLHAPGGKRVNLNRYLFSSTSAKTDADGFPVPLEKLPCDLGAGVNLSCEANSMLILCSGNDDGSSSQPDTGDGR